MLREGHLDRWETLPDDEVDENGFTDTFIREERKASTVQTRR
jgi:hypothetical protein